MKILALRLQNLASLEGPVEIDFAEGPLADQGTFTITGPTGAGKSTLLDAICLALYDRTPRLGMLERDVARIGRAGQPSKNRLGGTDVRGLLRHGAAAGYAEVDFRGVDGRAYRVRWQVRRARGRVEGALQKQEMSLVELKSGRAIGRTKSEVLQAVEARVGLGFEQFTRSVLLAQGQFAAFLEASDNDRASLLERMTGTELYGRISELAHERAADEKQTLERRQQELGDIEVLSAEVREATLTERSELQRAVEEMTSRLAT